MRDARAARSAHADARLSILRSSQYKPSLGVRVTRGASLRGAQVCDPALQSGDATWHGCAGQVRHNWRSVGGGAAAAGRAGFHPGRDSAQQARPQLVILLSLRRCRPTNSTSPATGLLSRPPIKAMNGSEKLLDRSLTIHSQTYRDQVRDAEYTPICAATGKRAQCLRPLVYPARTVRTSSCWRPRAPPTRPERSSDPPPRSSPC